MLIVDTLGRFQMNNGEDVLNDDNIRSDMLLKLLIYMLTHRERTLPVEEISRALWNEDDTDNPAGALKNLMYRLRTCLKKCFGDQKIILTNRGSYSWNQEVKVLLDVEEFERTFNRAENGEESGEKISCYERAIAMYQGSFMAKISDVHWIVTLSTYYHSIFLSCVKGVAQLYIVTGSYERLESLSSKALQYDNVDEQFHYYHILSLVCQNKQNLAKESYEKAKSTLQEELGVRRLDRLEEVHKELLNMSKGIKAEGIEQVQEDMQEDKVEGVFLCGYPVFREIYRLEARKITRIGEAEFVLLLSIEQKDTEDNTQNLHIEKFRLNQAMNRLEDVLKESLRIGDVAAKYSDSQYVILLPAGTYESVLLVTGRIIGNFYTKHNKKRILRINYNIEEVAAVNTIVK